jgi:apolipoprotein N-acyltransferase
MGGTPPAFDYLRSEMPSRPNVERAGACEPVRPRVDTWTAIGLAALSAALAVLSFPPFDAWPLAFVAWAPLLVALHGRSPRHALWLGGIQGLVVNAVGSRWLPDVIRTFVGRSWILCGVFAFAVYAYSAGRAAILAWLWARAEKKGWPPGLAFVLAFGATEALYPLLFPWYTGLATHRAPVLMQLAELGGPVLVGVPLAMSSVAFAEVAWAWLDRRRIHRARVVIALLGPAGAIAFGVVRMASIEARIAAAPAVKVGIVQGNIPHSGATLQRSITRHRDAMARLEAEGALDLVVWPETALSGILAEDAIEPALRQLAAAQADHPALVAPILTGAIVKHGDTLSNSAVLFVDGEVRGVYDKMHPLVFGEYLPFGDMFPELYDLIPNAGRMRHGTSATSLTLGEHRITPLICYEDILASEANDAIGTADPDLLVNLTNDSWFGRSDAAMIHLALAKFRAVEHRRYLVRATNSGVSAFVDPIGRATGLTPMMKEATTAQTVRWMRARTIYEDTRDLPWWSAAALVMAMAFVPRASLRRDRDALDSMGRHNG